MVCNNPRQAIEASAFKLLLKVITCENYYGKMFMKYVDSDKNISQDLSLLCKK